MFKVLEIDGPNIMTDRGGISLKGFSYADGGKSHPVSVVDWMRMRDLFLAAPEMLAALQAIKAAWDANDTAGIREEIEKSFPVIAKATKE